MAVRGARESESSPARGDGARIGDGGPGSGRCGVGSARVLLEKTERCGSAPAPGEAPESPPLRGRGIRSATRAHGSGRAASSLPLTLPASPSSPVKPKGSSSTSPHGSGIGTRAGESGGDTEGSSR
jgi:hypothetical protein